MAIQITEQMCDEVECIREAYIKSLVNRKIDHRNGDATSAQIEQWETDAAKRWDSVYPALAKLVAS